MLLIEFCCQVARTDERSGTNKSLRQRKSCYLAIVWQMEATLNGHLVGQQCRKKISEMQKLKPYWDGYIEKGKGRERERERERERTVHILTICFKT